MKKVCVVFLCAIGIFLNHSFAQLLATTPDFPTDNSSLTITLDASKGNKALQGFAGPVFLHTGVITNLSTTPSDWKYVQGTWATATAPQATAAGTNKWTITIPNIRTFYSVPAGEQILKITILFRNQAGTVVQRNLDGSDMYINVYQQGQFAAKFLEPFMQPTYVPIPEAFPSTVTSVNVKVATSQNANTAIKFNNNSLAQSTNNTLTSGTANVTTTCEQYLSYEAVSGATTLRDTVSFFVSPGTYPTGARPAGLKDGITFQDNNTSAVFILYAPLKNKVQLVGDFNNWIQTCSGLMTRETDANGNFYYWTKITGLTSGQSYRFQYIVDDSIRFADPYSPLVLDPNNDKWISSITYPNMPQYPLGKTPGDYVGVITPGETFNWTDQGYQRPNKYNLMIYELHMRDFLRNESWQSLIDTLPYLINLGFNAIKIMPFNEFDGNNSWGYNPCYFFAPDKAYGSKEKLKQFINEAHRNNIAVIMDVVFNHATGQSPLAKMWWNSAASKPAANNPYFFTDARHPFNVYNDFNHSSAQTKNHVERFIEYWLTEYKLDGFRWDLSKGFTPASGYTCTSDDVGCWGNFNQGRIDIWQNYYNKMQAVSNGSYCILEHFAADGEEYELTARGMMVWGKMNAEFNENTMGTSGNKSLDRAYWRNRWNNDFINDKPGLITYAESHDEERIMYRNRTFGNVAFRGLSTALPRTEAMAAIFMGIPGPKMVWQFGELGYDASIVACPPNPFTHDGTWTTPTGTAYNPSGGCRTDRKPIRWNYFYNISDATNLVPARRKMYFLYASMAKLRKQFPDAFNRTTLSTGTWFGNDLWKAVVVDHSSLKMVVVANFEGSQVTRNQSFPSNGTWYDYINGGTISVSGNTASLTLPAASSTASSYRVYINQQLDAVTNVENLPSIEKSMPLAVYPNPLSDLSVVKYSLPKSGRVQMQLLNLQGQVLLSKNMGFQLKGDQIVSLFDNGMNTTRLSSGTYLLQLMVDNEVQVEKVTIQR